MSETRERIITAAAVSVFALVSVIVIIAFGHNTRSQVGAHGGEDPSPPPYVRADGTVDVSKLPSREGVADRNGNLVGWMDAEWGHPGFLPGSTEREEWNRRKVPVTNEAGDVVVGWFGPDDDDPDGGRFFHPLDKTAVIE